jgi:peptidoglycan-N-acetylglucosamine deacetylase
MIINKIISRLKNYSSNTKILSLIIIMIICGIFICYQLFTNNGPKTIVFKETPPEIAHGNTNKKQVIFTFDGGSGAQSALTILDALEKHHIKGTFFLTGQFMKSNPKIIKQMIVGEHEIFNHTYDHPHLTQLPEGRITQELQMAETEFQKNFSTSTKSLYHTTTKPYFRAPYGDRDSRVLDAAAKAGYQSVFWTLDADDWEESTGVTSEQVKNNILTNVRPGEIFLMHIGDNITGRILDEIFTKIEAQGYKIVSLTQGI